MVVGFLFMATPLGNWISFAVYILAAVTDFLDGYLARAWGQQSALGRFLDPIADKLLVAAVLLALIALDHLGGIHFLPALIILCREILVSGLREFLAGVQVGVPVTQLAKWKTALQLAALGLLLIGSAGPDFFSLTPGDIGIIGLWGAAALTLITGYEYLIAGIQCIKEKDKEDL